MDDFLVSNDFNLGLDDLGLDAQLLEETGLFGIKSGSTSSNPHFIGSDGTDLGGSFSSLVIKYLLDFREISV